MWSLTEQFCRAILEHTLNPPNELIIIDNGSTDGTYLRLVELQRQYQHRLRLKYNETNLGFPVGMNQGLQMASGEYMVCASNDIWFYRPEWLEMLIAPLRLNKRILAGPRLVDFNELTRVDGKIIHYLEGWMLAFHKQFLNDVGYFDEGFSPGWFEDVDLSWRAVRHGYELVQVDLPVQHLYGKSALNNPEKFHLVGGIGVPEASRRSQEHFRDKVCRGDDSPYYPRGWKL